MINNNKALEKTVKIDKFVQADAKEFFKNKINNFLQDIIIWKFGGNH